MELKEKRKSNGGMWKKTWERCKSFSHGQQTQKVPSSIIPNSPLHANHAIIGSSSPLMLKSKSWSSLFPTTPQTPRPSYKRAGSFKPIKVGLSTPKGYLSVYVGPEKQRFVIKVKCTNHPLFKTLLEEAEMEYGFHNGPLILPCDVDMFIKVLFEMDADHDENMNGHWGCSPMASPRNRTSYHPLSSSTNSLIGLF